MPPRLRVDIISLLPETLESPLQGGVLGRAVRAGLLRVNAVDLRAYGLGRHKLCDDAPAGGGEGLVLRPEPIAAAFDALPRGPRRRTIYLSPQGARFADADARRLAAYGHLVMLCGRYEGVDERALERDIDEELSIGDYVLSGGELAALVVLDAVARQIPGVLGNEASKEHESFHLGGLEGPVYTRPRVFEGRAVPELLLSGDHAAIARWRADQARARTARRRPDLLDKP